MCEIPLSQSWLNERAGMIGGTNRFLAQPIYRGLRSPCPWTGRERCELTYAECYHAQFATTTLPVSARALSVSLPA